MIGEVESLKENDVFELTHESGGQTIALNGLITLKKI